MTVIACPVCFGAGSGPLIEGSNAGILALMLVTVVVLSGFAAFFLFLRRQAARAEKKSAADPLADRAATS